MADISKRQSLSFTCPSGGSWYACDSGTNFVGCCASNPCSVMCSDGNMRAVTFPKENYEKFPDASCGSGSRFYTCTGTSPPFWGCCKSNPCSSGCPDGNLAPAFMDNPNQKAIYISTGTSRTSTAASTGTSSMETRTISASNAATLTPSVTGSAIPATTFASSEARQHRAAIAGGAVGGFFALIIIAVLIYYVRHTRKSRTNHQDQVDGGMSGHPAMMQQTEKPYPGTPGHPDAPPGYSSPTQTYPPHFQNQYAHNNAQTEHYELPATATSTPSPGIARKPIHRRHLSELSGDTAVRSELESPWSTPKPQNSPRSPAVPENNASWSGHSRQNSAALGIWTEDGREVEGGRERPAQRQDPRGYSGV